MERAEFDIAGYEAEANRFMAEVRLETKELLRLAA